MYSLDSILAIPLHYHATLWAADVSTAKAYGGARRQVFSAPCQRLTSYQNLSRYLVDALEPLP
uniref:Uncharacterized protein n=1 Tax=Oryza sativa subsp. japonica TaxID=39947 RepID=Q6EUE4_ORYSJ|nr:hypothetical protein [Oryza sativa Japonica Group]